jgi:hypothetical protein
MKYLILVTSGIDFEFGGNDGTQFVLADIGEVGMDNV